MAVGYFGPLGFQALWSGVAALQSGIGPARQAHVALSPCHRTGQQALSATQQLIARQLGLDPTKYAASLAGSTTRYAATGQAAFSNARDDIERQLGLIPGALATQPAARRT